MKHLIKKHRFLIVSFSLLVFLLSFLALTLVQFPARAVNMTTGATSVSPLSNQDANSIGVCVGEICTQDGVYGYLCNLNNGNQDCKKNPSSLSLGCRIVVNPVTGVKEGECVVGGTGGECKMNADCQEQTKGCGLNSSGTIACVLGGNGGPCSVDNDCSQYQQFGCDYLNGVGRCILNGKDGSCVSASDCKNDPVSSPLGCSVVVNPVTGVKEGRCVVGGAGGTCKMNADCLLPDSNSYSAGESQSKPAISNVVPAEIPQEKPTTVTIIGNNFTEESKVVINGKVLPINMAESTPKALSVDVPRAIATTEGNYNVKVLNPGFKDNLGFSNPKPIAVVKKSSPALLQNPVLRVGGVGVATQLLNIRSDHSAKATVLGKLAVDETATVTAGPITSDGYVWWQVSSSKVPSGWVAEKVVVNSGDLGSTTVDQEAFFIANKPKPGPTITKDQLVSCEGKDVGGVCRSSSNDCTDGVIKGPGNPGGPYPDNKPARPFDDCKAKGMPVCCKTNNSPNKCEASPNNGTCKKTSNDCSNGVIVGLNGPFDDCKAKGMSVCCKPKLTAKTCAELASVGKQCVFLKDCKGGTQTYPKPSDCNAVDKDCCIPKSITSSSIDTSPTTSSSKNSIQIKCSDYQEDFIPEEKQKNWSCKSSVDCLVSKGSVLGVDTDCKEKNMICCGSGK